MDQLYSQLYLPFFYHGKAGGGTFPERRGGGHHIQTVQRHQEDGGWALLLLLVEWQEIALLALFSHMRTINLGQPWRKIEERVKEIVKGLSYKSTD